MKNFKVEESTPYNELIPTNERVSVIKYCDGMKSEIRYTIPNICYFIVGSMYNRDISSESSDVEYYDDCISRLDEFGFEKIGEVVKLLDENTEAFK